MNVNSVMFSDRKMTAAPITSHASVNVSGAEALVILAILYWYFYKR